MKNLLILFLLSTLVSCEKFVTSQSTLTLSGKYVVSTLDVTNVDQNQTRDSLYTLGDVYVNHLIPDPLDSIEIKLPLLTAK